MTRPTRSERIAEDAAKILAALDDKWQTVEQLRARAGIPDSGPSQYRIRDAIRHLNDNGWPIVSSEHGFKRATTLAELDAYIADLKSRANSILRRATKLEETRDRLARENEATA